MNFKKKLLLAVSLLFSLLFTPTQVFAQTCAQLVPGTYSTSQECFTNHYPIVNEDTCNSECNCNVLQSTITEGSSANPGVDICPNSCGVARMRDISTDSSPFAAALAVRCYQATTLSCNPTYNPTTSTISLQSNGFSADASYRIEIRSISGGAAVWSETFRGSRSSFTIPANTLSGATGTVISVLGPDGRAICNKDVSLGAGNTDIDTSPRVPLPDYDYCKQVPTDQQQACINCVGVDPNESGNLYTAVGCIQVDEQGLAADLIRLLLGITGGVALLSILAGAFIFTTSQGESNRVKQAKELITAAVSGLFFIIFIVIILDFIGVKLLQIPGLG